MVLILAFNLPPFGKTFFFTQNTENPNFLLDKKLEHLSSSSRADIQKHLLHADTQAFSFNNLHSSKVLEKRCIEQLDARPMFHKPCWMSPEYIWIIETEIGKIFKAGIIVAASYASSFLVELMFKKDDAHRFSLNSFAVNQVTQENRRLLQTLKIHLVKMSGVKTSKPSVFSPEIGSLRKKSAQQRSWPSQCARKSNSFKSCHLVPWMHPLHFNAPWIEYFKVIRLPEYIWWRGNIFEKPERRFTAVGCCNIAGIFLKAQVKYQQV